MPQQVLIGIVAGILSFALLGKEPFGNQIICNRANKIRIRRFPTLLLFEIGKGRDKLAKARFALGKNETDQLCPLLSP